MMPPFYAFHLMSQAKNELKGVEEMRWIRMMFYMKMFIFFILFLSFIAASFLSSTLFCLLKMGCCCNGKLKKKTAQTIDNHGNLTLCLVKVIYLWKFLGRVCYYIVK